MGRTDEKQEVQPVLCFGKWCRTTLFCVQEGKVPFCLMLLISHLNLLWKLPTYVIRGHHKKKYSFTHVITNSFIWRGGGEWERVLLQSHYTCLAGSKTVQIWDFPSVIYTMSLKSSVWAGSCKSSVIPARPVPKTQMFFGTSSGLWACRGSWFMPILDFWQKEGEPHGLLLVQVTQGSTTRSKKLNLGSLVSQSWLQLLIHLASSSVGSHLSMYAGHACSPRSPGLLHPMQGTLN